MRNSFGSLALSAAIVAFAIPHGAALAQIDPVGVGQGAVHSTTMRQHSNRIAGRSGTHRSASERGSNARAVCAKRASIRARHGEDDPRVRRLYDLCNRLGY